MKKYLFLILLILIILLGSYLRLSGIATNSFAFTYDVGRDMLAVQQIVYHHKIPLIGFTTGVEGIFYGPWWYYILTLPFALSGGNPQFVAYFIALTGIATFVLFYYIGKKIGGEPLGVTLALLLAISPALIGISGQIWNPNIAPFWIACSLIVILLLLEKPRWWLYLLLGLLSGLLIEAEIVFGSLLLVSYFFGLFVIARRTILKKQFLLFFLGLLIIFSPRILFEFRHQFLMTKTLIKLLTPSPSAGGSAPLISKLSIFFNLFSDTTTAGLHIVALLLLIILCIITFFFRKKMKGLEQKFFVFSLIVIGVFMIGISFFRHDIWPHYLIGIPVFYIVVTGILLTNLRKEQRLGMILWIAILLFLTWVTIKPADMIASLNRPLFAGDAAVYRNQLAIIDYIYGKAQGQPFNYVVYTPPIYDYTYQYLFSWYGVKQYHYAPSQAKATLFFLIIEPDTEHPTLLRDWLKVREHDGKIISQQIVKGGVRVQMRVH